MAHFRKDKYNWKIIQQENLHTSYGEPLTRESAVTRHMVDFKRKEKKFLQYHFTISLSISVYLELNYMCTYKWYSNNGIVKQIKILTRRAKGKFAIIVVVRKCSTYIK